MYLITKHVQKTFQENLIFLIPTALTTELGTLKVTYAPRKKKTDAHEQSNQILKMSKTLFIILKEKREADASSEKGGNVIIKYLCENINS